MGTKRHRRGRHLRFDAHPAIIEFFRTGDEPAAGDVEGFRAFNAARYLNRERKLEAIWTSVCDEVVAEWIAEFPGTRPFAWWEWTAGEPRERIGGFGSLLSDFLAHVPTAYMGIPTGWVSKILQERGWPIASINGSPTCWSPILEFAAAEPFDPNDPPLFEAQAVYLQRKGLLADAERRKLSSADFEPEAAVLENWLCDQTDTL